MKTSEIIEALECFCGTTAYYKHTIIGGHYLKLTDGCHYVREACKAYWLFDILLSYQSQLVKEPFQCWHLKKLQNNEFVITATNGNNEVSLVKQEIPYSDFPLDEIKIWLIDGVALLPSEY